MNKKINKTDYIPNEKKTNREIVLGIHGYISGERTLKAFDEALREVAKKSFDDVCEEDVKKARYVICGTKESNEKFQAELDKTTHRLWYGQDSVYKGGKAIEDEAIEDEVCEPEKENTVKEEEDNYRWVFVDNKDLIKSCDHKEEPVKETFLDRMIKEFDQLEDRLTKLNWFLVTEFTFDKLSDKEFKLMGKQSKAMTKYLYILSERIDIIKEKEKNETNRPSDTRSGN